MLVLIIAIRRDLGWMGGLELGRYVVEPRLLVVNVDLMNSLYPCHLICSPIYLIVFS
jgi:hypothetical protein